MSMPQLKYLYPLNELSCLAPQAHQIFFFFFFFNLRSLKANDQCSLYLYKRALSL